MMMTMTMLIIKTNADIHIINKMAEIMDIRMMMIRDILI